MEAQARQRVGNVARCHVLVECFSAGDGAGCGSSSLRMGGHGNRRFRDQAYRAAVNAVVGTAPPPFRPRCRAGRRSVDRQAENTSYFNVVTGNPRHSPRAIRR
jgi:hypothetical protein